MVPHPKIFGSELWSRLFRQNSTTNQRIFELNDTVQQTAADSATEAAIESVVTNAPPAQTEAAFNRASVEHRRSAPREDGKPTEPSWRDDSAPLAPMPDAPPIATSEVDAAVVKLNERGGDHAALVASWGPDIGKNLAWAKSAFADIVTNRPDLIQKFEAAGLGDDPSVLQHLASYGRLNAGLMGDFTIARRNNEPMPINRTGTTPVGPAGNYRGSEIGRAHV